MTAHPRAKPAPPPLRQVRGEAPAPGMVAAPGGRIDDPVRSAATALVKLHAEMLEARSRAELAYLAANEPRQLLRAQQIVVLERRRKGGLAVRAVSSLQGVDRASPAILWFESMVEALEQRHGLGSACAFKATGFGGGAEGYGNRYPLGHLMWVPWLDRRGAVMAGMLLARTTPFGEAEAELAKHVAGTLALAWAGMSGRAPMALATPRLRRRTAAVAALGGLLALAVPVPMTALAPVETAPRGAAIVTAGVEGIVRRVMVEPSEAVRKGQPLVQIDDTVLRNRFEIAEREVGVAEMKYKKAAQLAFVDARGRHELGLAQAELALRTSERNYALDLLSRTEIKAERDGAAFFGDKRDLVGRPVAVGEKLMEVADPAEIEFRIDLGVGDAIVLREGAHVKVFLDSDPLNPIPARLVRSDYRAKVREGQPLAFRLVAEAEPAAVAGLRLGVRGTAQVYSDAVPLGFYLFRRPIAALRQWVGL